MRNVEHRRQLELRDDLFHLAQIDADAVAIYDEALKHATEEGVRSAFESFRIDHKRHLAELPKAIQHFGWATPEFKVDLTGYLEEWAVALFCVGGTAGALRALLKAERQHNKAYGDSLMWEFDDLDLPELLRDFHAHEARHLAFVEQQLHYQRAS